MNKLSVVIPCYNEAKTLAQVVAKVGCADTAGLELEIIIIDDCSADASFQIAQALAADDPRIQVLHHAINQG
ncbi:MAG: glycosyltransferase, partial [Magnetovibrio sp.]|nr:glycosyltransferase [Magnetovibrio sp.]